MPEWVKTALLEQGGGLIILLVGIMLAIAGSHKLLTDELLNIAKTQIEIQESLKEDSEKLHDLDKRVTILELTK